MAELGDYYGFRDALADAVIRDLVGPGRADAPRTDEEVLTEAPMTRYVAGILYPPAPDPVDAVQDNDVGDLKDSDGEEEADPPIAMANVRYPSAMGLTCGVDADRASVVRLTVSTARYQPEDPDEDEPERWVRYPLTFSHDIQLQKRAGDYRHQLGDGLEAFIREREPDGSGQSALTVALINTLTLPQGEWRRDSYSFFQVEFDLSAADAPVFVDRSKSVESGVDDDARSFALLYRHSPSFAVGHGCGASWRESEAESGRASLVRSAVTPSHDLLLADNNPEVTSPYFGMRRLAEDPREEIVAGLRDFVAGYESWIVDRHADVEALGSGFTETARRHLADCSTAAGRITGGIDLLAGNDQAWLAFQLANRSMLTQRARAEWAKGDLVGDPDLSGDVHQWRAFQIGFILMTLQGIADPESDERPVVDLLWFPTGGGKTEAYLGLIAFTVFLRRLRGVVAGGTGAGMTVIMRYTLRLLTLQQYQRAAMLICACESIRRSRDDLGAEEISIGLWVGGASTPNDLAGARASLEKLRASNEPLQEQDPVQLRECPWCATKLSHRNYWVADHDKRLVISCRNEDCEFERGLPCYLVDEDIYARRPTLMIATVDKFASMPWRETIGSLFNIGEVEGPPELIIQDELHLISGPLGTMVGLYETAVHMLCSDGGIGPKIIASTATIRRAEQQIRKLYAADSFQFPPPGIDARDSYFAVEVPRESKGTRRYVGLMAPGTSHATLLVRSYAALLQMASEIEGPKEVRDPYWTLLGYFNSLRVLGGARMQVRDDVCDRIELLAPDEEKRRLTSDRLELIEMTSRVESSEIPGYLQQMGLPNTDDDCLDVILATNMISVGVDVDRLGLMAVMGQPQSSSEYIQATSRVGRRHPGLVMVLFNSARSRDRSHYEDFESFHGSLYRQVDASSVTPFAARARDRALHAVFIGMLRARVPVYRENKGAANVADLDVAAQPVINQILDRVRATEPDEVDGTEAGLRSLIKHWKWRASETPKLVFSNRRHPELALLADAGRPELAEEHEAFSTMWSLRAVDTESNLFLVRD
jgi:hypothetical protein